MTNYRQKYPKTVHLPNSPGTTDDKKLDSVDHFEDRIVVVTEKLDGECTTLTPEKWHARSLDTLTILAVERLLVYMSVLSTTFLKDGGSVERIATPTIRSSMRWNPLGSLSSRFGTTIMYALVGMRPKITPTCLV